MTEELFEQAMDNGNLDGEYSSYIMAHGDRPIGNGTMLIEAMEDGYLYDEFKDYMTRDQK